MVQSCHLVGYSWNAHAAMNMKCRYYSLWLWSSPVFDLKPQACLSTVKHGWQVHSFFICWKNIICAQPEGGPKEVLCLFSPTALLVGSHSYTVHYAHRHFFFSQTSPYIGRGKSECDRERVSACVSCDITQEHELVTEGWGERGREGGREGGGGW